MGYQQQLAVRPGDFGGKCTSAVSSFEFVTDAVQQPHVESYRKVSLDPASYEVQADATRQQVINQQDRVNVRRSTFPS